MWEQDTGGGRMCVCVVGGTWDYPIHKSTEPPQCVFIAIHHLLCALRTQSAGDQTGYPLRAHLTRSDNIVYKLWSKCSFCLHSADVFLHSQRMNMNWAMVKCICANTTVKFHAATLATKILTYVEECIFCGN